MTAPANSSEPSCSLPNSRRVYVQGTLYPEIRVPMREITLAPSQGFNGGPAEANDSVRVYDCSGPWGDPEFHGDITQGLPRPREAWIRARSDVEEYEGREVAPMDNGYLSAQHAEYASQSEKNRLVEFPGLRR